MNVVMVIYFGMLMISNDCWDASNEMKWKKKKKQWNLSLSKELKNNTLIGY
jgi:hypothetical protein